MKSFLSSVGHFLKVVFVGAEKAAVLAEPFIAIAFPGLSPLYNTVASEVGKIEAAAEAAGAQTGTGAQKLAMVLASPAVQAAFLALETTAGLPSHTQDQQTAYINAVVATINALNPPTQP